MALSIGTDLDNRQAGDLIPCDVQAIWIGESMLETREASGKVLPSEIELKIGTVGSENWFNPYPCLGQKWEKCEAYFPSRNVIAIRPTRQPVSYPLRDPDLYPQDALYLRPVRVLERVNFNRQVYRVEYMIELVTEQAYSLASDFITVNPASFITLNWRFWINLWY